MIEISEKAKRINEILEREYPNWAENEGESWESGSNQFGEFDQVYIKDRPLVGCQDIETDLVENGVDGLDFVLRQLNWTTISLKVYRN